MMRTNFVPVHSVRLRVLRLRRDQLEFRRDEMQGRVMALHDHLRIGDHLRGMDGCRERRRGTDEPEFAKHALFEIRKSGALPRAPARPRDRDAAYDTEIQFGHVLKPDRLPMLHEPLRSGGGLEIHALRRELVGIDTQVRKAFAQIGNRREQELAVVKRAQADGNLWRIGGTLDDASAPPFVKLAEPFRRDIRANEIRNAVENRADVDLSLGQSAPYPFAYGGLRAIAAGPSRIATLVHFRLIRTILRLARAQR